MIADAGLPGSRAKRRDPVKCGARVALGVAGGYFLGRTKKMKLALALAGMAAGKRAGGPGQLLTQGTKLLGQSPEVTRLTDELRGRLLDAGKGAAVAIAARQVEALKLPEDKPKGEAAEEESDVNDRNLNVIQRIPVRWPDSVDGSEASEAVTFALDGRRYTLDLSKDNAARLREALAPFIAVARRSRTGRRDRRGSRQAVDPGRQR